MKIRRNNYIFILLLIMISGIVVSCRKRPSCVLDEKKMVDLLVDMELAEAYTNTQNYPTRNREEIGKSILESHGVSEETLDTTLAWYGRNMDDYLELFEKVDKEIQKRKKIYTEIPGEEFKSSDNLWPFGSHALISELSGYDNLSFAFPNPEIEKGEIILMSMYLPNSSSTKATLGVEYTDGSGESVMSNGTKNKITIDLQTDSSRTVSRIFGSLQVKDNKVYPVFIDSIRLTAEPLDSLTYRSKRRSQRQYGAMVLYEAPVPVEPTDSITVEEEKNSDSISVPELPESEVKEEEKSDQDNSESKDKKKSLQPVNINRNKGQATDKESKSTDDPKRFEKLKKNN